MGYEYAMVAGGDEGRMRIDTTHMSLAQQRYNKHIQGPWIAPEKWLLLLRALRVRRLDAPSA